MLVIDVQTENETIR